jgi:hypothetical protein
MNRPLPCPTLYIRGICRYNNVDRVFFSTVAPCHLPDAVNIPLGSP